MIDIMRDIQGDISEKPQSQRSHFFNYPSLVFQLEYKCKDMEIRA